MKCSQVQHYLLEQNSLGFVSDQNVANHLQTCTACAQIEQELLFIKQSRVSINLSAQEQQKLARFIMEQIVHTPQIQVFSWDKFNWREIFSWRALVYAASVWLLVLFLYQSSVQAPLAPLGARTESSIRLHTLPFFEQVRNRVQLGKQLSLSDCLKSPDCQAQLFQQHTQNKPYNHDKL